MVVKAGKCLEKSTNRESAISCFAIKILEQHKKIAANAMQDENNGQKPPVQRKKYRVRLDQIQRLETSLALSIDVDL